MTIKRTILSATDSYKCSMWKQYPEGTNLVYSYIESRGGVHDEVVLFGVSAFIQDYLTTPVTMDDVKFYGALWDMHGEPFNWEGWEYIVNECNGYLPVQIHSLLEGTVAPVGVPLVAIENTDPNVPWLTTWIETALLRAIWYPTTVATNSREAKKIIADYLELSGDMAGLPFKLHDFGARGVSSGESAVLGGMAHLINFMGTDTFEAIVGVKHYYPTTEGLAGFSIPAAEHSTITSWGKENEVDAYRNMLKQFGNGGLVAVVSDSYDIYNAVDNLWGDALKAEVEAMDAMLVVRPDSGDPVTVVSEVMNRLGDKFGYTTNDKGFNVLNNVRVIQGDGINLETIADILRAITNDGWSADNIAFGMGGALLQGVTRDDQKFAMKCSAIGFLSDGRIQYRDVFKDPITDTGKRSKAGFVTAFRTEDGELIAGVTGSSIPEDCAYAMEIFYDFVKEMGSPIAGTNYSFDEVRANAAL